MYFQNHDVRARLAQWIERKTSNLEVLGSSPRSGVRRFAEVYLFTGFVLIILILFYHLNYSTSSSSSSFVMSQIWLVTVPNVGSNNKKTYTSIQELLRNMKLNEIEIPHLVVGTLDSLIALADELSKICSQAEV